MSSMAARLAKVERNARQLRCVARAVGFNAGLDLLYGCVVTRADLFVLCSDELVKKEKEILDLRRKNEALEKAGGDSAGVSCW